MPLVYRPNLLHLYNATGFRAAGGAQCERHAGRRAGWPEDYDLWLRRNASTHQMAKLPQVLLHWRDHPAHATRTAARYLLAGPLHNRERVISLRAGQMGQRLPKHLQRAGAQLAAFLEVNPEKYGTQLRGVPVCPPPCCRSCTQPTRSSGFWWLRPAHAP